MLPDGRVAFVEAYLGRISQLSSQARTRNAGARRRRSQCDHARQRRQALCHPNRRHRRALALARCSPRVDPVGDCVREGRDHRHRAWWRAVSSSNDLAFGPDGNLYFTDPGRFDLGPNPIRATRSPFVRMEAATCSKSCPPPTPTASRFCRQLGHLGRVVHEARQTSPPQRQDRALTRVRRSLCIPDGFAVTADGNLVIATCASGLACVLSPTGQRIGEIAAGNVPTNCAFDGSLYVTDGGHPGNTTVPVLAGCLWIVETEHQGAPLHAGGIK